MPHNLTQHHNNYQVYGLAIIKEAPDNLLGAFLLLFVEGNAVVAGGQVMYCPIKDKEGGLERGLALLPG